MELLAALGQYLLLTFVLPGFCYLFTFGICFRSEWPAVAAKLPPMGGEKDISKGAWFTFFGVIGGLLLSSVTFATEILLRSKFRDFTEEWFPAVDFSRIPDTSEHSLANLFTAMAFMHFNIAVGIGLILIARLLYSGRRFCAAAVPGRSTTAGEAKPDAAGGRCARCVALWHKACAAVCRFVCAPATWIACCFLVVSTANIAVTSHLFRRVDCMARTSDTRFSVPDCMKWTYKDRQDHPPKAKFTGPEV
jgi:hypothetical protein